MPTEYVEEVIAGITQPYVTGEGKPSDFFEAETQLATLLTIAGMQGTVSGLGASKKGARFFYDASKANKMKKGGRGAMF